MVPYFCEIEILFLLVCKESKFKDLDYNKEFGKYFFFLVLELSPKGKSRGKQRSQSANNDQPERPLSRGGTLREQENVSYRIHIAVLESKNVIESCLICPKKK